jgi:hypothetical protein
MRDDRSTKYSNGQIIGPSFQFAGVCPSAFTSVTGSQVDTKHIVNVKEISEHIEVKTQKWI